MARNLHRYGSVQDIRATLKLSPLKTIEECDYELEQEQKRQNRSTVIQIIEVQKRAIIRKKGGKMAKVTRIHFEDHGQDFLWWDVDTSGKVIDCGPFQASVWVGSQIIQDSETGLVEGDRVLVSCPHVDDHLLINYPIERLEEREVLNG
jgi:hypothetical protein